MINRRLWAAHALCILLCACGGGGGADGTGPSDPVATQNCFATIGAAGMAASQCQPLLASATTVAARKNLVLDTAKALNTSVQNAPGDLSPAQQVTLYALVDQLVTQTHALYTLASSYTFSGETSAAELKAQMDAAWTDFDNNERLDMVQTLTAATPKEAREAMAYYLAQNALAIANAGTQYSAMGSTMVNTLSTMESEASMAITSTDTMSGLLGLASGIALDESLVYTENQYVNGIVNVRNLHQNTRIPTLDPTVNLAPTSISDVSTALDDVSIEITKVQQTNYVGGAVFLLGYRIDDLKSALRIYKGEVIAARNAALNNMTTAAPSEFSTVPAGGYPFTQSNVLTSYYQSLLPG